ncbi:hypothetical protein BDA99DRAFT_176501 [Phascolomyces articulosus]|uniref:Uncharacterized protein n=1 Tax=Phascolomyces articulosus TaxID=60185 RepID=A0AAD5PAR3_9FUNG|nr:hypothetical protein BDA99DRAFT_176501 [Phascolomyces articulosus]
MVIDISIGSKPKANYNSKNDVVRINDMDAFLAAGSEEESNLPNAAYTLLHGDKNKYLVDVKLKDGSSIPMERRAGETKLRIPDFVLNDMAATTGTSKTREKTNNNDNNCALVQYHEPLSPPSRVRSMTGVSHEQRTRGQHDERMMDVDHSDSNNNEIYHNESNQFNKDDTLMAMEID